MLPFEDIPDDTVPVTAFLKGRSNISEVGTFKSQIPSRLAKIKSTSLFKLFKIRLFPHYSSFREMIISLTNLKSEFKIRN